MISTTNLEPHGHRLADKVSPLSLKYKQGLVKPPTVGSHAMGMYEEGNNTAIEGRDDW